MRPDPYGTNGIITHVSAEYFRSQSAGSAIIELTFSGGGTGAALILYTHFEDTTGAVAVAEICNTTIKLNKSGVKLTKKK